MLCQKQYPKINPNFLRLNQGNMAEIVTVVVAVADLIAAAVADALATIVVMMNEYQMKNQN